MTFGDVPATSVTVLSSTSLEVQAPSHAAGPVDIKVETSGGQALLSAAFTYFDTPIVASFAPAVGAAGTLVTISGSNFDSEVSAKPEFVHPENYGDDLARWFMTQFRDRKLAVDEEDPSQEDHGWYVTFTYNKLLYDLIVIYAPANGAAARWLACIEKSAGLFGTMIGQRHRAVTAEVVQFTMTFWCTQKSVEMFDGCTSTMSAGEIWRRRALHP